MSFGEIKQILNKQIVMDINQEKGSVPLKENNPQSKLKEVEIYGLHKDTVVFKLDDSKLKKKSQYLSDEKGLHSGCDYVIVTRYNEKSIVFVAKRLNKRSPYPKIECFQEEYQGLTIKYFKNTQKINLSKILGT
jgi:hypothetical protein